ncbi:MAG TPA: glycosyltransferase family 2 protein [Candidatus Bathyarchaeia archaeon]|nr:glycosyltransferase family 2 protein [Candidatus Bathyarchaeia archaeon]
MSNARPGISLIMPVYNEAPNIEELMTRCVAMLESTSDTFEIIAVDDGSTDESAQLLHKHHELDPRLRIVRLVRNFGQTPALYAGMSHARGDVVVIIDADLQNPPEEIPKLLRKLEEGYDVVQGWREKRRDSLFRKIPSKLLNAFISRAIEARVRDLGCGMKVFRRDTVERMNLFKHRARYLPADIFWLGVKIAEVKIAHDERRRGKSKYNVLSLFRLMFELVIGLTSAPVKAVSFTGWLFTLIGIAIGAFAAVNHWVGHPLGPAVLIVALVLFVGGVQLVGTGIVCEYISRIYAEVQGRPYYLVKEVIE